MSNTVYKLNSYVLVNNKNEIIAMDSLIGLRTIKARLDNPSKYSIIKIDASFNA